MVSSRTAGAQRCRRIEERSGGIGENNYVCIR